MEVMDYCIDYLIHFVSKIEFDLRQFKTWLRDEENVKSFDGDRYFFDNHYGLKNMQLQLWNDDICNGYDDGCIVINIWKENILTNYHVDSLNYVLTTTIKSGNQECLEYLMHALQKYSDTIIYVNGTYCGEDSFAETQIDQNQENRNIVVRLEEETEPLIEFNAEELLKSIIDAPCKIQYDDMWQ